MSTGRHGDDRSSCSDTADDPSFPMAIRTLGADRAGRTYWSVVVDRSRGVERESHGEVRDPGDGTLGPVRAGSGKSGKAAHRQPVPTRRMIWTTLTC